MVKPLEERFWENVDKGAKDECWEWCGSTKNGYGKINRNGKEKYAHRISYEIATGDKPGEMHILHHCDNKPCVNPNHLYAGTHQDNMQDALIRGRYAIHEDHPQAKLSREEIETIREEYNSTEILQRELADRYDVTQSNISKIIGGESWID